MTFDDEKGRRRGPFVAEITADAVVLGGDATWALRNSASPFWLELRERLEESGLDPQTLRVVDSYEEGTTQTGDVDEVGVLLTSGGRFIRYRYSYRDESWRSWEDISDRWRGTSHEPAIRAALGEHGDPIA